LFVFEFANIQTIKSKKTTFQHIFLIEKNGQSVVVRPFLQKNAKHLISNTKSNIMEHNRQRQPSQL